MKILTLIIKKEFYDQIISGEKKKEYREITPNTEKRYCEMNEDGYCKEVDGIFIPRHYDAIRFYVGYNKGRKTALVKVIGTEIALIEDENHEVITYEYNGMNYLAAQVIYDLGEILEK